MYCILVSGIPAAGKSTFAEFLSDELGIPVIAKDIIKEIMFDDIGFQSREEKVKLGTASMNIMYYAAEQLMKCRLPFILENNFESVSREGLLAVLGRHSYTALTVTLTGDYERIYQRFLERNSSPDRHRGHVVNDCFPEKEGGGEAKVIPYESFVGGITRRGMDHFIANGPQIIVDTTDFERVDKEEVVAVIRRWRDSILETGD